ncbi:MAG: DUF5665 domain-containing protein [Patescibacteria group bacterium]
MTHTKKKKSFNISEGEFLTSYTDHASFSEYVDFVRSPLKTFGFSFLRGTGYGLGIILGASLVLALLNYTISALYDVPGIGDLVKQGVNSIEQQPAAKVK